MKKKLKFLFLFVVAGLLFTGCAGTQSQIGWGSGNAVAPQNNGLAQRLIQQFGSQTAQTPTVTPTPAAEPTPVPTVKPEPARPASPAQNRALEARVSRLERKVAGNSSRLSYLELAALDQWRSIIRLQFPAVRHISTIFFRPGETAKKNFSKKIKLECEKQFRKGYTVLEIWGSSSTDGSSKANEVRAKKRAQFTAKEINKLYPGTVNPQMVKSLGEIYIAGSRPKSRSAMILWKK